MSVLNCGQNALDEFPSARLSLARLCPHRALFCLTVRRPLEQSEGKKRMIFRAYASKNPGVWGRPQGALRANLQFLRFCYCQILTPSLTPRLTPRLLLQVNSHIVPGRVWYVRESFIRSTQTNNFLSSILCVGRYAHFRVCSAVRSPLSSVIGVRNPQNIFYFFQNGCRISANAYGR